MTAMDTKRPPNEVGAFEAKTHFAALLERTRSGEEFVITHRGQPVARLSPIESGHDRERALAAAERIVRNAEIIQRRSKITLDEIREWIDEGRP